MKDISLNEIRFTGVYAKLCSDFIGFKKSLGYDFRRQSQLLQNFDNFSKEYGIQDDPHTLPEELVCAWIRRKPNERAGNQGRRIICMRHFAQFLNKSGFKAYVHPQIRFKEQLYYEPYIFRQSEIEELFYAADHIGKRQSCPLYHLNTPVILRLLYGCGLRVSEVTALTVDDVDLNNRILIIRNAKLGKDRLVPMSASLVEVCRQYSTEVFYNPKGTEYFFKSVDNGRMSLTSVYSRFRSVLLKAGIAHGGRGKGPRLHDLRHTFAVHCLSNWANTGKDVRALLPVLSSYLGHNSVTMTEKYLRLTPEMFSQITELVKNTFGNIMPQNLMEVENHDC